MPAWWSRKSSKNKQERDINNDEEDEEEQSRSGSGTGGVLQFNFMKSPINAIRNNNNNGDSIKKKEKKKKSKPKSFDEVFNRNSPRTSREFDGGAATQNKGLPLPLPVNTDQGSLSGSGSSVSSSTSFSDHPISPQFTSNNRLFFFNSILNSILINRFIT
jgi:hypothetical protein